jgi:hypothetical protein
MEKPDYGNWVPQKVLSFFLLVSIFSYHVTLFLNTRLLVGLFRYASTLFLGFFIYLVYVYWLLEKDDKMMQRRFWDLLIDQLKWDGGGKALDIGTGGGPVAILLARHPESLVKCINY